MNQPQQSTQQFSPPQTVRRLDAMIEWNTPVEEAAAGASRGMQQDDESVDELADDEAAAGAYRVKQQDENSVDGIADDESFAICRAGGSEVCRECNCSLGLPSLHDPLVSDVRQKAYGIDTQEWFDPIIVEDTAALSGQRRKQRGRPKKLSIQPQNGMPSSSLPQPKSLLEAHNTWTRQSFWGSHQVTKERS